MVTDEAKEALAAKGFDPAFGARPLKRLIQREIGDRLALAVLEGRYLEGDKVTVDIEPDLSLSPPGETDGDKAVDNSEGRVKRPSRCQRQQPAPSFCADPGHRAGRRR